MQSGITLEKQLGKAANVAFTYLYSRGVHTFLTRNINAPLRRTTIPRIVPWAAQQHLPVRVAGDVKQNQFIVNGNVRVGTRVSLSVTTRLTTANSDTAGVASFPSNQYDLVLDYGRASFDTRQRLFLGGSIALPYSSGSVPSWSPVLAYPLISHRR